MLKTMIAERLSFVLKAYLQNLFQTDLHFSYLAGNLIVLYGPPPCFIAYCYQLNLTVGFALIVVNLYRLIIEQVYN